MSDRPFPHRLTGPAGLVVEVNRNGSIRRMDHGDVTLNLFLGSEVEGGPANVWLRRLGATPAVTPLLGPGSPGMVHVEDARMTVRGEWADLRFALVLVLAQSAPAWCWHLRLENVGAAPVAADVVLAHDLALAPYGAIRMNEYYVSQYVDCTPLAHPARGWTLAVRQNLAVGERHPWALLGALDRADAFATDALQLHGLATRAGVLAAGLAAPALPAVRRQHEHAMAALQSAGLTLAPGAVATRGFFGWLEPDHPAPSSADDLAVVARAAALPEAAPPDWEDLPVADAPAAAPVPVVAPAAGPGSAATLFSTAPLLACRDASEAELAGWFPGARRHVERDDAGRVLSFFGDPQTHVVLAAKERAVLRPHGHILRTGDALVPDEAALASTVWMDGVFHSLVTQGHVNINRFLSTVRSYLGLQRAAGLRLFLETDAGWRLLGVPSAFAMTPGGARWVYAHPDGVLAVASRASTRGHALGLAIETLAGAPRRLRAVLHVAFGGDDGAAPAAVAWERDGDAVVVRTDPETDFGRRFPEGSFRIAPAAGTAIAGVAGDEALFFDGASRRQPYLVLDLAPAPARALAITGGLIADDAPAPPAEAASRFTLAPAAAASSAGAPRSAADGDAAAPEAAYWTAASGGLRVEAPAADPSVARVPDVLPWFAHDALVHYLAPRGLEQYSGGGWGTRDVCQGPVELLLALGRMAPLRDLLVRVFAAQNPDGDWPQWFTFFARDRGIRAGDSHGDIVYWPLLALAQYLDASDDHDLLAEPVPFFHPDGDAAAEAVPVATHVARALEVIAARQIPGTSLAAYGHGDWNDSLQPADPAFRERLCSAWTVTLQYQTARALAAVLGRPHERSVLRAELPALAARCAALAERSLADFQRLLLPDDVLAGFAYFHEDGRVEYLLHPRDARTGIRYRLLPMIHAIIDGMLTPEEARAHLGLMRAHLVAPDGARLFDRPPAYRGGEQRLFQRAETSTFWGREIGLMYVHAHLRYAEAMATLGEAEAFWLALRQAIPIGLRDVVPHARLRQANCYASSSDADFADRYEAAARYGEVMRGAVAVEGGWRVYSSGAGIAFRLLHERLFGIRRRASSWVFDPVLPRSLDGLAVELAVDDRPLRVVYAVGARGAGPTALALNGRPLPFAREPNPYRTGAAVVPLPALAARLRPAGNELRITLA